MEFALFPEMIAILLYVEALEDNEVIFVEDVRQIYRIMTDSNKRCFLEPLDKPRKVLIFWYVQSNFIVKCNFLCYLNVDFCMFNGCRRL